MGYASIRNTLDLVTSHDNTKVMETGYPNEESGGKREEYKRAISACK